MKVLILVNAYVKNQSQISQAMRIKQEFESFGVQVEIKRNVNFATIFNNLALSLDYDCCIFLDKDKSTARIFEKTGLRLFNNATAIELCDDKMLTHIALANNGIKMPNTISAPLCYYNDVAPLEEFLSFVASSLGFPLVAKKCYGSLGAGVNLISDFKQLEWYEKENMLAEHFYQEYVPCSGTDTRVIVIGGKVLCAMKRINDNDFRSNIELGGRGEPCEIDFETKKLCEKASKILGLDYCGIDILTKTDGEKLLCEVNSNAFFAGVEKYCGVNVAKAYVEHVLKIVM